MITSKRVSEAKWIESRNRWQINVQRDGERKTFTSSVPGRKGKIEAEAKADKWLSTFNTEQKFGDAAEAYLNWKKERVTETSFISVQSAFRKHIVNSFPASKKLNSISVYDWQRIIERIADDGGSELQCNKIRGYISNFILYCEIKNWEIVVPKEGQLEIPKTAKAKREKTALTADQLRNLFELNPDDFKDLELFQFAVLTGLRKGEIFGLQWSDIGKDTLTVNRAVEGNIITNGKTQNARRQMPLQDEAIALLKRWKAKCMERGTLSQWVFPAELNVTLPMNGSAQHNHWKAIAAAIDAPEITIHELRHTFISIVKGDVRMEQLKAIVGHSDSMDTIGIYGHTTAKDLVQAGEAVNRAFDAFRATAAEDQAEKKA